MSADKEQIEVEKDHEEEVETNYQPPPQKSIEEILATDQEDESLRKYKEALLGAAQSEKIIVGALDFFFSFYSLFVRNLLFFITFLQ